MKTKMQPMGLLRLWNKSLYLMLKKSSKVDRPSSTGGEAFTFDGYLWHIPNGKSNPKMVKYSSRWLHGLVLLDKWEERGSV